MSYVAQREPFDAVAPEWEALLAQQGGAHIFSYPSFQRAWLEVFGGEREPLVYTVREAGRLVGVAPLLRNDSRITFIGDHEVFDYMDFVVTPGRELPFLVAVLRALLSEPWEELDLRGLAEGSLALECLPAAARELGLEVSTELEAVAPHVDLAGSWDDYLASLSKKSRHEVRRKLRRLAEERAEPTLRVLTHPDEAALNDFFRLHRESRKDKAEFMTEQMETFFRRMAGPACDLGQLRLYMMDVEGRPAAAVLCFACCDGVHMYNSGFDPELGALSVGLVSKILCLRKAIEDGKKQVDFMRGDEAYKYQLGSHDVKIFRCHVRRAPGGPK